MTKSKMFIIVLLILGLGAVACAGYAVLQNNDLRATVANKSYALDESQKKIAQLEQDIIDLQKKLSDNSSAPKSATPAETTEAATEPKETDAPAAPQADGRQERMAKFREMMKGPAGEIMAKTNIGRMYGDLFKTMKLSPAEKEQLSKILMDAQLARMQGNRNDPNQKAQQQTTDAQIKALLGDSRYSEYQTYNTQTPVRDQVSMFETSLAVTSTPLTPDQKAKMVDAVATQYSSGSADTQGLYNTLGTVLTPEQLTEFTKWQATATQMRAMGVPLPGAGGGGRGMGR